MKLRRFLSIVPKTVQLWASVFAGCALLIGLVAGYKAAGQGAVLRTMFADGSAALVLGVALCGQSPAYRSQPCFLTCWDFFFTLSCLNRSPPPAPTAA
jgi:hypothetical protein